MYYEKEKLMTERYQLIIKKGKLQGVYDIKELRVKGESLEEIFVSVIGEEDK